jgi:xanthine dehydrogenase YagS FAD-binding subunit
VITFPKTADEALIQIVDLEGVYRAGGTDLQERRKHLAVHGQAALAPIVDLRDLPGLDTVASDEHGAWIGALASLASIAEHPLIRGRWPGVADACGALANPQIRALATLGGNLMQAPRCWYHRHPDYQCLREGGATCFAREGDHLWHVCFDDSPCAAPHPSTVAMALVAYEAEVELLLPAEPAPVRKPVADILAMDALPATALLTTVRLGPPVAEERSAYVRASNRAYAEWALAEVTVRLVLGAGGEIEFVRVAGGGVAPVPLRLREVEAALHGKRPEAKLLTEAAAQARVGAKPLPMTAYKLDLLEGAVLEALERALEASPTPAALGASAPTPSKTEGA